MGRRQIKMMRKILLVSVNSSFSHTNIAVRYLKYYADRFLCGATPQGDCDTVAPRGDSVATPQGDCDSAAHQGDMECGPAPHIHFCDFTINQPLGEIIRGINSYDPDMVLFSTYIWNVETVVRIAKNIKALKPELVIGAGGPEAGFRGTEFLKENPEFDLIVKGEGEETFRQLAAAFGDVPQGARDKSAADLSTLSQVKGLFLRKSENPGQIYFTGEQELICDLGTLPFPYPDLETLDVDHKIFYYESSRGCPFSCAYCMSSLDTKVRFVPLEKVFADLQRFMDAGVKLVKFVDRTYNLKSERYVAIWKYIMEHHNGKTMFHFEIEGEFLSEEAMEFLQTVPAGIMQFEIGVQSSNPVVLKACGRSPETETLRKNILRIPKTIHTHLDLIAGLPFEDLESFGRSLDFVMTMKPDALQLGFLKILYGASVNKFCGGEPGWKWMKTPPYEILETPYLKYEEILFLKDLEVALDAYWNDHHFDTVMRYLAFACSGSCHGDMGAASQAGDMRTAPTGDLDNVLSAQHCGTSQGDSDSQHGAAWWELLVSLTTWLRTRDAFSSAHQKDYWAQMLHEYLESQECVARHGDMATAQNASQSPEVLSQCVRAVPQGATPQGDFALTPQQCAIARELLRFDYIAGGKKTNPPAWLLRNYDDQKHYDALQKTTGIKHSRLDFVYSDFDTFKVNPFEPASESAGQAEYEVLFLYARKESDRPSDFQRIPHQILIH